MSNVIDILKYRKTNQETPSYSPPPEPNLQDRIERIKCSINRINALMQEFKNLSNNTAGDTDVNDSKKKH